MVFWGKSLVRGHLGNFCQQLRQYVNITDLDLRHRPSNAAEPTLCEQFYMYRSISNAVFNSTDTVKHFYKLS